MNDPDVRVRELFRELHADDPPTPAFHEPTGSAAPRPWPIAIVALAAAALVVVVLLRSQGESRRADVDPRPTDAFAHDVTLRRESARLLIVCSLPPDPPVPPLGGLAADVTPSWGGSPPLPLWTHDRITNHWNESTE